MMIQRLHLSDAELECGLKRLAASERYSTVTLVRHLSEFGARRLFLPAGFSSLFKYCVAVLHLSEHAAFHRIVAARLVRRFPGILDLLEAGSLTLTTVKLLAPYLTSENQTELIGDVVGKGRRDVERLLAARFPERDRRSCVRRLPSPAGSSPVSGSPPARPAVTTAPNATELELSTGESPMASHAATPLPCPAAAVRPDVSKPVAEDLYRISFTASATTYEALQRARELLGHVVPSGDYDRIIQRALTLLIADLSRRKFATTDHPRSPRLVAFDSRYIPAAIRRAVWVRDGGQCAFVSADGRRCDERRCLEFHHLWPFAENGKATVENIQLRCRAHNVYESDLFYAASRDDRGTRPGPSAATASAGEVGL
jgi:hypothetical protein